jgi:hypothetical protein
VRNQSKVEKVVSLQNAPNKVNISNILFLQGKPKQKARVLNERSGMK